MLFNISRLIYNLISSGAQKAPRKVSRSPHPCSGPLHTVCALLHKNVQPCQVVNISQNNKIHVVKRLCREAKNIRRKRKFALRDKLSITLRINYF